MSVSLSDFPANIRTTLEAANPGTVPKGLLPITNEEREKAMQRSEREAQKEISQFLRVSGIWFVNPPMNRKSALPTGAPDFIFARNGSPTALEVKVWGNKPRPEQNACHEAMRRNGWLVYVVSGAAEVKDIFRAMDEQSNPRMIL